MINADVSEASLYVAKRNFGKIDMRSYLNVAHWDEVPKFSKQDYLKYLTAFNDVNSSRSTILFSWCFYTTISYLAEALVDAKWKKQHKFTQINTFKQDSAYVIPYDLVTEEVTFFLSDICFRF